MAKIKRKKVSKRKTKTRRNCAPCLAALNPGYGGIRRRNPDPEILFKTKGRIGEKLAKLHTINFINRNELLDLFYDEEREDIEDIIDEADITYGDADLTLVRMDTLFDYFILDKIKQFGILSGTYLNL